jgi:hypothetical protein
MIFYHYFLINHSDFGGGGSKSYGSFITHTNKYANTYIKIYYKHSYMFKSFCNTLR